jgi:hypothetical protein
MVGARLQRRGSALASLGLAACAEPGREPEPAPSDAAEVVVAASEGARLCAGTEAWVTAEIERVQTVTGLMPMYRLPVTLGRAAVDEHCSDPGASYTVLGCTLGDGGGTTVLSTPGVLSHELVHALRRHYDFGTRAMLEEGFAEAINGSDAYPRHLALDPAELPEARWPEVLIQQSLDEFSSAESYRAATHFMEFLQAEHGTAAMASFMTSGVDRTTEAALMRFESHFGIALAEQAQAWRDAGEQGFGRGDPCAAGVTAIAPSEAVELVVRVDCDEPGTLGLQGAGEVAWVRHCVALEAGRYAVALHAAAGAVRWEAVAGSCAEGSSALDSAPKHIEAGTAGLLDFAACSWVVTFESMEDRPEVFTLALDPE